ncbi:hypothetical protein [Zhongshania sp.]|uniref:hypothetical protein n=1 Tax=Zhongshania sp. TaxID=1971902 RepID=UPI00356B1428
MGARISISSLYSRQAEHFLSDWMFRKEEPQPQAWSIAYRAIERAINWYPVVNPNLLINRGRIHDWRDYKKQIGDPVAAESRLLALADYRRAAKLQPSWPYTWIDIALVKTRLGIIDQEALDALQNAFNAGQWRPDVLLKITETGVFAWEMLPTRGKKIVIASIDRGLASNSNTAGLVAKSLEQLEQRSSICNRSINEYAYLKKWCNRQGYADKST